MHSLHPMGVTARIGHHKFSFIPPTGWRLLYDYTVDLMCLDYCRPISPPYPLREIEAVTTPLCVSAWQQALEPHPDRAYSQYIINGLRYGFRIGFHYGSPLRSASHNMPSATSHTEVVLSYISARNMI